MKPLRLLFSVLLTSATPLHATEPPSKPQQLTSPDQVPEGLAKSDWSSIRAAYETGRHAFQPVEGGWQAHNPGQQWTTKFDGHGFLVQPKDADWQWGFEFKSYGFGERQTQVSGTPAVRNEGQCLTYQWDDSVQEWFVNDPRGLEHGFTITRRPTADEGIPSGHTPLSFTLATRGSLRPRVSSDALTVHFCDVAGAPVLNYSGLKVWDADGKILTSHFEAAGESQVRLLVEETGARYPLTIDPIAQQAYIKASVTRTISLLGSSVAVSGDTVVVGASFESSSTTGVNSTPNASAGASGAAYVFVRSGGTWNQQAYLKASNTGAGDGFGISVAVSGDTLVVGAYHEDSSTTGVNSTPNESASESGAAYVFVRDGGVWSQQAYLKPSNSGANDWFGYSVSMSGDTVLIGAHLEDSSTTGVNSLPNDNSFNPGAAYVFARSGGVWSQQAYLKASGIGLVDKFFGRSVAVGGDTLVVGASGYGSSTTGVNSTPNNSANSSGAAYVFVRSGDAWSQQAYLKASNTGQLDEFGYSVAVSGDTVVIGAPFEDSSMTGVNSTPNESASASGAAYVFARNGGNWSQQAYLKASNTGATHKFGFSVAVSGDAVVVGAPDEGGGTTGINSTPSEGASGSGAAYVFVRSGGIWSQQAYMKASNTGEFDQFGWSVATGGDTVVVGAPYEESGTNGVNSAPNESASQAGAAYIFTGFGPVPQAEIEIKQAGANISNGASQAFGSVVLGSTSDMSFSILNTGSADLTLTGAPEVTGSTDFTVTVQPISPITGPSGNTSFTVQFAPTSIGAKTAAPHIASNDASENPFTINLSGSGVTAITAYNNAISANSTLSGPSALPSAIPFTDGIPNLLKYAFNMNAAQPDVRVLEASGTSGLPKITVDSSGAEPVLKVAFLRRKGSGLIYTPQRSDTLGTFVAMTGTQTVTSIDTQWERVIVEESAASETLPSAFARVQVSLP